MSRLFFLLILNFISFSIIGQGISFFHGSWEEALEEAKKTDKIIFVDAYAKWCGPCKVMAKNVFTQEKVGAFFNDNFINLKLDMEEKEGLTFGKSFSISAFPTLFFINSKGELIKKSVGGKKAAELLALASDAIKSYDRSDEYAEKYKKGDREFSLMLQYIRELNKVGKPSLKIANEYMAMNPKLSKAQKAEFLLTAVTEADSKIFDQLISVRKDAIEATSEEEYITKIESACLKTVSKAVEYDYIDLLDEAIVKFDEAKAGDRKMFEQKAKLAYHEEMGNFNEWKSISEKYLKKYGKKDPSLYKKALSSISKNFNYIPESTELSNEIANELVKKEDSMANYLMYIQMLVKCEKNKEALKVSEEALKKAKKRNENFQQLENYIDYIKKQENLD